MWGKKTIGAALAVGLASASALGQTALDEPGFTFLESREGNSFRYSFEFALPVGVSGLAFEFVSQTDGLGSPTYDEFKSVEAGSTSPLATISANGWSVLGHNGDSTVFFMSGDADVRLSFDVVFHGDLGETTQWNLWFYTSASRAGDGFDPFDGWGVLDTEVTDPNLGGGGAPEFNPTTSTTPAIPLPNAASLALVGLAPLVLLRRRQA